ncbi:MAG: alpha/beta hydrolase family protein [Bryobacteraceae bacterium]
MSEPYLNGHLHRPSHPSESTLLLTHGAGSNCNAPLLIAVAEALAGTGWTVYRFDLPFRRARPHGPPSPSTARRDREGIREAVQSIRVAFPGPVLVGGHSYGCRQSTMAAAEDPALADGLLLLSYPLHPPNKPEQLRTAHFPSLRTKAAFVHGSRDGFGSPEELQAALALIPAPTSLHIVQGAGHDLGRPPRKTAEIIAGVVRGFFIH